MLSPRPSPRASGAGASAYARYRAALAEGRPRRLLMRAALTLAAAVVVTWVWGWRAGLTAAVLVAVADTVHRWRTHEAVRTWRKGALGERRTARMPRPLARRGYTILHDRAIPGSRANVNHLVIGGAGVFVVDTKHVDTKHSETPHVVTDEASSTAAGKHRLPDQRLFPVNQPPL